MPDNAERLLLLALETFCDITPGEREVLRCAATGEWADLARWEVPPQPEGAERKPGGGPLRSAVLKWLCADDVRAKKRVHRKGVCILNATLDQPIDFERAEVPFFFGLHSCRLPGLNAPRAKFGDTLSLQRCRIDGTLDLIGAHIGGQFICIGALIVGTEGVAIRADRADIGDNVYLSNGFQAVSEVRLLGAKIKGVLYCSGGSFLNRKGSALNAEGADIGGDVSLSDGFWAVGEVSLLGAKIKGQLNCNGGRFLNRKGNALNLECASIGDTLFLEPKPIQGKLVLFNAKIATCLRMTSKSTAASTLDLRGAKVGELIDTPQSWPEAGKLLLDGFQYDDIHNKSPRRATVRIEWLRRMPDDQFLPQPFEQLAGWFQKTGHDSEARDIRVAKEKARMKQWLTIWSRTYWRALWDKCHGRTEDLEKGGTKTPNPAAKPWKLFLKEPFKRLWWWIKWLTIGYGYKPHYAAVWLIMLISLGSYIYSKNLDLMTTSVSYNFNATEPKKVSASLQSSDYPDLNTLLYSTDVALPIVDLQQERYWMPNSSLPGGNALWWFNRMEVLLGWFFASMGIAGVTGIIKKD